MWNCPWSHRRYHHSLSKALRRRDFAIMIWILGCFTAQHTYETQHSPFQKWLWLQPQTWLPLPLSWHCRQPWLPGRAPRALYQTTQPISYFFTLQLYVSSRYSYSNSMSGGGVIAAGPRACWFQDGDLSNSKLKIAIPAGYVHGHGYPANAPKLRTGHDYRP